MDTRFLESYLTVVEVGSMAEAARRLDLTASAVAQRIRTLEAELGVKLIVRSGRTVRPTPSGAAILQEARKVLSGASSLKTLARHDTLAGELRLGAITTALTGMLPQLLSTLVADVPGVELYVVPGTSVTMYPQVLSGELDAAIVVKPSFALPKTLGWHTLRIEPLICIAPRSQPIEDVHALLGRTPFIRYDRNHWGGRLAHRYLMAAGIRPRERLELDSLEAIAILVDRGLGVSLIPDWAPPWPEGIQLNKEVIRDDSFAREIGLTWPRSSSKSRIISRLVDAAKRTARRRVDSAIRP